MSVSLSVHLGTWIRIVDPGSIKPVTAVDVTTVPGVRTTLSEDWCRRERERCYGAEESDTRHDYSDF